MPLGLALGWHQLPLEMYPNRMPTQILQYVENTHERPACC